MPAIQSNRLGRDAAAMLLAAAAIGFAYNCASPLGIRSSPGLQADAAGSPYSNETLALEVESNVRDPRLGNETLSLEIVPGAAQPAPAATGPVTWPEAKQLLSAGSVILVDARSADAFGAGHIPGAVSLPFVDLAARISQFTAAYPRTSAIIVYCADTQCPVSAAEAAALRQQFGYLNVREMPGGYVAWRMAEEGSGK
jgi:rhodanese-related sulfurtransferase